jgi:hypothetical protein
MPFRHIGIVASGIMLSFCRSCFRPNSYAAFGLSAAGIRASDNYLSGCNRPATEESGTICLGRTRECGGVGLGLAIAEWIVQQHRGRITLQSILGQGSTFTVEVLLYMP